MQKLKEIFYLLEENMVKASTHYALYIIFARNPVFSNPWARSIKRHFTHYRLKVYQPFWGCAYCRMNTEGTEVCGIHDIKVIHFFLQYIGVLMKRISSPAVPVPSIFCNLLSLDYHLVSLLISTPISSPRAILALNYVPTPSKEGCL